jgi:hypothetical protein
MDGTSAKIDPRLNRAHLASILARSGAAHLSGCPLPQRSRLCLRTPSGSQVPCPPTGLPPQPGTSHTGLHPTYLCTLHTSTFHLYVAGSAAGTLLPSAYGCLRTFPGILEPMRCLLFSVRCTAVSSTLLDFCPLGFLLFSTFYWHGTMKFTTLLSTFY